jgi:hypothetical protein
VGFAVVGFRVGRAVVGDFVTGRTRHVFVSVDHKH